jgi:sec-independent protein translocase protein TatC
VSAAAATHGLRLPVSGHVREARRRAARAGAALAAATAGGYLLSGEVLDLLRAPILALASSHDASLNYATVTGAFDLRVRIALVLGLAGSAPVWLFQLAAFVAPGLTRRERACTMGFLLAALPLFAGGCAAGLALFPHMVQLLTGLAGGEDSTFLDASAYFDFVTKVVLGTGLAFTLPVFVVLLNVLGVLPAATIRRGWRLGLVGVLAVSALITPPADVLSMFLVAVPMAALLAGAWAIAHLHDRRAARRSAEPCSD